MNRIFGVILVILGTLFILDKFHIDLFEMFWPSLIIAAGVYLIYKSTRRSTSDNVHAESFGGSKRTSLTGTIRGSNYSYFINDTDLDLTGIELQPGDNHIRVSTFIGDVRLTVPKDAAVRAHASNFIGDVFLFDKSFGGFITSCEDKTSNYDSAEKRLVINCSSFIGDIKVYQ
ncbi:MAG: cell wall-active antibiotics response protein LiaF [Candidatus Zixiibacteriota bacterium]